MNTLLSAALLDVNWGNIIRFRYRFPLPPLPMKALPHMPPLPLSGPVSIGDKIAPRNLTVHRLSALVDLGHVLK